MTITVDMTKVHQLLHELQRVSGVPMVRLLKDNVRFMLKTIIGFLPPKTKKAGDDTVKKDFRKLFLGMQIWTIDKNSVGESEVFLWSTKDGIPVVADIADWKPGSSAASIDAHMRVNRKQRGRVGRAAPFQTRIGGKMQVSRQVVSRENLQRALADRQARVGRQKAGWWPAYQAVGGKLPSWITRHQDGAGSVIPNLAETSENPDITMVNFAAGITGHQRIVNNAVKARGKAIITTMGLYIKGVKQKFKV